MRKLTNRITSIMALTAASLMLATNAKGDTPDFALSGGDELIPLYEDTVLVFRQGGTLHVTGSGYVDILLVGGGGGGGSNGTYGGAGGGAGGVVYVTNLLVTADNYAIAVGAGGAVSTSGESTTALGMTAYGGGKGANGGSGSKGGDGASGGGSAMKSGGDAVGEGGAAIYSEYQNDGNAGGGSSNPFGVGGGGGAGKDSVGETTGTSTPGRGGDGYWCSIVGTNVCYGGGGAGFRNKFAVSGGEGGGGSCVKVDANTSTPEAGADGFGGGGCGGARGGSGVVIIRYRKVSYKTAFRGAEGGTVARRQGHFVHTFTSDGMFTMPVDGLVEVLLVGGGGGGGTNCPYGYYSGYQGGGGGGAGGVMHLTNLVLTAGAHSVVIGQGGDIGYNGGNTIAFGRTAYGGGGGAKFDDRADSYITESNYGVVGSPGASGGGSTHSRKSDYTGLSVAGGSAIYGDCDNIGNDGGVSTHQYGASGGGGAGGPGGDTTNNQPGTGGVGYLCDISGIATYYAGGGAGFRYKSQADGGLGGGGSCQRADDGQSSTPMPGVDGLGGGGCGGARGGSGVVIVRYQTIPNGLAVSFR